MAELDRASPAFDQTLPVHVELPGREPRTEDLVVRVLLGSKVGARSRGSPAAAQRAPHRPAARAMTRMFAQQSGTQRSKVQHVEVTSDADLCMLFAMDVSEEDFHLLKQDQSILIDFHNFPEMLIELLCKCGGDGGDGASRCAIQIADRGCAAPCAPNRPGPTRNPRETGIRRASRAPPAATRC